MASKKIKSVKVLTYLVDILKKQSIERKYQDL